MNLETSMAINPFGNQKGKVPEIVDRISTEQDPLLDKILEEYESLRKYCGHPKSTRDYLTQPSQYFTLQSMETLTPAKIDLVLRTIIDTEKKLDELTGIFLTKLIQDSYNAGYNGFVLTTGDALIDRLGYQLRGMPEKELELTVRGNAGWYCGENSKLSTFTVEGSVGTWYGSSSKHCFFKAEEHVGWGCGFRSEYSLFILEGDVGGSCGIGSEYCSFELKRGVGTMSGTESENSLYTLSNQEAYEEVKKNIPRSSYASYNQQ